MEEPVEQLAFSLPVEKRHGHTGERIEGRQGQSRAAALFA
jgi:hypothetical protein